MGSDKTRTVAAHSAPSADCGFHQPGQPTLHFAFHYLLLSLPKAVSVSSLLSVIVTFLKSPSQFFCRISFSWDLANAFTDEIGVCVFGKVTTETNALLPPSPLSFLLVSILHRVT